MILPSLFWCVSSNAAKILGVANPDPFNVWTKSILPSEFLNLIFPLLDWKSSKLLQEETSNHFSSPGAQTSRSKHLAAAKLRSPEHNSTTL